MTVKDVVAENIAALARSLTNASNSRHVDAAYAAGLLTMIRRHMEAVYAQAFDAGVAFVNVDKINADLLAACEWLVHLHHGVSKGGPDYEITDAEWKDAIAAGEVAIRKARGGEG